MNEDKPFTGEEIGIPVNKLFSAKELTKCTAQELCNISKENFSNLLEEHVQLEKGFGPLATEDSETNKDLGKAMFMQEDKSAIEQDVINNFLNMEDSNDDSSDSNFENPMLETVPLDEPTIVEPQQNENSSEDGEDTEEPRIEADDLLPTSVPEEDSDMSSMASSSEEEEEDLDETEVTLQRVGCGEYDARMEIYECIKVLNSSPMGIIDCRIPDKKTLEQYEPVLALCLHWDVEDKNDSLDSSVETCTPRTTRKPLYALNLTSWFLFVCAIVYEACRQGRERACLKENIKALTGVDHPVLNMCSKREAFEDYFDSVTNQNGEMFGIRDVWDALASRVCVPAPKSLLADNPEAVTILSPIYSILGLLKSAESIEWCESVVPESNTFYCALTGTKLIKGEKCYACNIRVVVIEEGEDSEDAPRESKKKTTPDASLGETSIPKRDIMDNPFLIGHDMKTTVLCWTTTIADGVEPIYVFETMAALAQVDLYLKKSIREWLDAESAHSSQENDSLTIANSMTNDSGIEKIVEWYSYMYNLCYILDVCIVPQ